jgi:maltooligosyltrehalose trehalohydrolase
MISVMQRNIGVFFSKDGKAHANVWAPGATTIKWHIDGSEAIAMQKESLGYWHAETDILKPGGAYRFQKDDTAPLPDPASLSQPQGVHNASAAIDTNNFGWKDGAWGNVPLKEYIIYELHIGTFTAEGTFRAAGERLDYLKELGITAIEVMPVAQFPGDRNWGYDGVFPFAVQNSYGGAEGLQQFVDLCHQKGLAVILDVVYNHVGPEGNYLSAYGPYFTNKYGTPWGEAVNFDDAWCDGVRNFFIENALMWFRDFRVDALRLDAVHAIKDFSPTYILKEIRQNVDALMEATGRRHYLIAECDLNDTRFINAVDNNGGYGMDAQWIDEFHHALRVAAGQERSGYYADFDGLNHLCKAYRDAYVYDGQYSEHRKRHFGVKTENPGQQFVVFSQNHDQVGNRMLGERSGTLYSFEMQKLLAGAVLISSYLPLLFMGEEYGETAPFLYFVSHNDPDLIEAVRKGRKAEFTAFHAQGEAPDPQAGDTFNQSKLQWGLLKDQQHHTMLLWYQVLINLRKKHKVLASLNRKNLHTILDEAKSTLILKQWQEGQQLLYLMNFSGSSQKILSPATEQPWKKLLDSASPQWNGPKAAPNDMPGNTEIILQPQSIIIYANS